MKHWVVAAALCLGVLLGAGLVVLTTVQDEPAGPSLTAVAADDEPGTPGSGQSEQDKRGHGHHDGWGPPPWVRGGKGAPPWPGRGGDEPGTPAAGWKQSWQDLTERERDELMADLARKHAAGMRRWADCVEDSGDPAGCSRPTPPGQAKKQQVR